MNFLRVQRLLFLLALTGCSTVKTSYNGTIDDVSCENIAGWAMDWSREAQSIDIRIFDEGGLVKLKAPASIPRGDFRPGAQNHGFSVPTPVALKDGKNHFVHVAFEDSYLELRHSPRPLNCQREMP